MSENQEMVEKLLNEKDIKNAMIQANKTLPEFEVHCYDSTGKRKGKILFWSCAETAKKTKLSNRLNGLLKDCKEETKFDAWLGNEPGKGKEIKFEGKGLTGKSSIFKLFCAAVGGASTLDKLVNKRKEDLEAIMSDRKKGKITVDEYRIKLKAITSEVTKICIQVVE